MMQQVGPFLAGAAVASWFFLSQPAKAAASSAAAPGVDCLVLLDFDQFSGLTASQTETFIDRITAQLVAKKKAASVARVLVVAVGNRHAFLSRPEKSDLGKKENPEGKEGREEAKLIKLRNMNVLSLLVPSHKKEEADRWLERLPRILFPSALPARLVVLIVSNDQDFCALAKELRAQALEVLWMCTYEDPSSSARKNVERFAGEVWPLPALPEPSSSPPLRSKL